MYDVAPGKTLAGRFTIVGSNRQGGFSTAFEATDGKGERCELQLFPSGLFEGESQASDFRRRLQPWTVVQSPAVLGVRELIKLGSDGMMLVTDFPRGESLRSVLNREKNLDPEHVAQMGRQLLGGLEEIHGAGLTHGDIKPYTIFLDGKGDGRQACLVDGGVTPSLWVAKDLGEKTALIGTPYYAPVEQFGGDAPDVRSDIYNLAAVLYEAIAGALPWRGTSFFEVFQAKLADPLPMAERSELGSDLDVPKELESAILRGCFADRRKRFASAREFLEALS